ncbi:MAG: serine/threonine-protein kinase [Mariprofundaceae bacterium]
MKCSSCGVDGPVENGLCKNCGAAVSKDETQTRLGHYLLTSKLGEGGMGVVYRAQDEKLGREVAVKVLHPHLLQHENLKERFRREARMHAKIIHPNVVTLLSLYEDGEHMALVMEMVHGVNLRQYLREHPHTTMVDILRVSEAILGGLDAAHKLGMVHRDLKPANVLLAEDGSIKLMDFGLAKPSKEGDDDLTQSGATVGSFRYMAPEQILNQPVDARTDLYSFGILLYQMCTGKLPFDSSGNGAGEFEIMEKQIRQEAVPPIKLNTTLPKMLSDLIMDLLAKNIADRPANCAAVHQILLQIGTQEANTSAGHAIKIPPPSESQSNAEIAKGLMGALLAKLRKMLGMKKKVSVDKPPVAAAVAKGKRWHAPLTWAGLLLVLVGLGWILTSVIHVAEQQSGESALTGPQTVEQPDQKALAPKASSNTSGRSADTAGQVTKKAVETAKKAAPKPVAKPKARPKPKAKKVVKSAPRVYPVTYRVDHKLIRSDGTRVTRKDAHEFKGKSRLYFPDLKSYRWKETLHTFKKGQLRLYLDKPVRVSKIVIQKASVGRSDFKGGNISINIQDEKGKWHEILDRKDRDIDRPLTIRIAKSLGKIKGVRMRFRSSEPITIGPIDLLP